MKKYTIISCLLILGMALAGVSYGHTKDFHKKDKYGTEISKMIKAEVSNVNLGDQPLAILNPGVAEVLIVPAPVVHGAFALPKHYLLPTKRLWLLNCQIALK